jgi:hypothetical protein
MPGTTAALTTSGEWMTRIAAGLPFIVIALLAAGCGGQGGYGARAVGGVPLPKGAVAVPGPGVLDGVPAAAARTLSTTARVSFSLDRASVFGSTRAPVFGHGAFDFSVGSGREVIDLPELRHQEPGTEHVIFLPGRVYLQPRASGGGVLPRGKHWLAVTLTGAESVRTNFPNFIGQVEGVNPGLLLQEILWGATQVAPIRQPPSNKAVRARGYAVSIDLARALGRAGGTASVASSLAIQEQLTARGSTGRSRIWVFAWIDRTGRVVQLEGELPGSGTGTALVELSSFGTGAPVSLPAAAQVVGIGSLTPSGERENNGGGDSDGG